MIGLLHPYQTLLLESVRAAQSSDSSRPAHHRSTGLAALGYLTWNAAMLTQSSFFELLLQTWHMLRVLGRGYEKSFRPVKMKQSTFANSNECLLSESRLYVLLGLR
jgi:hypothetical protein